MFIAMEGIRASAGAPATLTGLLPARFPINIDRQLLIVDRRSIIEVHVCITLWYISIAIEGRRAPAGALAPATGHAPAHTPFIIDR